MIMFKLKRLDISNKIYHIELDDYSTPAFVSFGKNYYGTMDNIEEFISRFKDNKNDESVKAFQKYKDGNRDVEITVAYRKTVLLKIWISQHSVMIYSVMAELI